MAQQVQQQYPPGTELTRDEDGVFRGPDGQVYVGSVLCKDLHQGDDGEYYFTPVVPKPRRRPWWQRLYLEAQVKLGLAGKVTLESGEVLYMNQPDRDFIKHVYGDSLDIE